MKSRLPAVLLVDFDGTVVETEMMIFKATNMMLERNGFAFQLTLSEYSDLLLLGNTETRLTHYFDQKACWPKAYQSIQERAAYVKKLKKDKDACFDALVKEDEGKTFYCRPGILKLMEEVIIELKGKCCIVSNTATATVEKLFSALVLNTCSKSDDDSKPASHYQFLLDFVHIIGGDTVAPNRRKPAPDLYKKALTELECEGNYCNVVVIEDSKDGLNAAISANLSNVIITKSAFTKCQDFKGAKLVLDHLPHDFSLKRIVWY
jgi:beta-phosphoglucomutase-like phosphatase (HAD superfamily)